MYDGVYNELGLEIMQTRSKTREISLSSRGSEPGNGNVNMMIYSVLEFL